MSDELKVREHIEHLHLLTQRPSLYLDRSLSIALDDYRDAIVAATTAEYEAKLAALEFERDDLERVNAEFFDRIGVKREQIAALEAKYTELLYAVAQKFVGESRHETALRYIREREIAATQSSPNAA